MSFCPGLVFTRTRAANYQSSWFHKGDHSDDDQRGTKFFLLSVFSLKLQNQQIRDYVYYDVICKTTALEERVLPFFPLGSQLLH